MARAFPAREACPNIPSIEAIPIDPLLPLNSDGTGIGFALSFDFTPFLPVGDTFFLPVSPPFSSMPSGSGCKKVKIKNVSGETIPKHSMVVPKRTLADGTIEVEKPTRSDHSDALITDDKSISNNATASICRDLPKKVKFDPEDDVSECKCVGTTPDEWFASNKSGGFRSLSDKKDDDDFIDVGDNKLEMQAFLVAAVGTDVLFCFKYDEKEEVADMAKLVLVAKPIDLRLSLYLNKVINGITYTTVALPAFPMTNRRATANGIIDQQFIFPPYVITDANTIVYAAKCIIGAPSKIKCTTFDVSLLTDLGFFEVPYIPENPAHQTPLNAANLIKYSEVFDKLTCWIDTNNSGRVWAKVPTTCYIAS